MKYNFSKLLILISLLAFAGCSSTGEKDDKTAEGVFKQAKELEEKEYYEESIVKYTDVKNRFPYSKLAVDSKLKIADLQYERESFIEAQAEYQLFHELHPKHERSDYVVYRLAMSYFQSLPSTIDRDLSSAYKAIFHFDELIKNYPRSQYVNESTEKRDQAKKMLGQKELYVAQFYFIREMYESSLRRFEKIAMQFQDEEIRVKSYEGATRSALELGDRDKARRLFAEMEKLFPDKEETQDLKKKVITQ